MANYPAATNPAIASVCHAESKNAGSLTKIVRQRMRTYSSSKTVMPSLLKQMQSSVASSSHIAVLRIGADGLCVRVGRDPNAIISVSICDPTIPSFAATYPCLKSIRGKDVVRECTFGNMLAEGVVWVVRKVYRYGFVPLEGYRKEQVNRGKPNRR
jgi:hypothetical protein